MTLTLISDVHTISAAKHSDGVWERGDRDALD